MDTTGFWLALTSLVGGFLQPVVGFGYAVFVMIFFPLFLPSITDATTITCLMCLVSSSWLLIQFRKSAQPKRVSWLIVSFLVAMPIAMHLATLIPRKEMGILLGIFLLAVGLYYLIYSEKLRIPCTPAAGLSTGVIAGIFSGLFAISAPPAALYCLSVMDTKEGYIATLQFFFVVTNIYATTVRIINGLITLEILRLSAFASIGMAVGMLLGEMVYRKADLPLIKRWSFIFIALMGVWTIISNLI